MWELSWIVGHPAGFGELLVGEGKTIYSSWVQNRNDFLVPLYNTIVVFFNHFYWAFTCFQCFAVKMSTVGAGHRGWRERERQASSRRMKKSEEQQVQPRKSSQSYPKSVAWWQMATTLVVRRAECMNLSDHYVLYLKLMSLCVSYTRIKMFDINNKVSAAVILLIAQGFAPMLNNLLRIHWRLTPVWFIHYSRWLSSNVKNTVMWRKQMSK